jgi:Arc/MetJ family transcription regulator
MLQNLERANPAAIVEVLPVRTNIDIDDRLMRQAMRATGSKTKRAVVETALRLLVQTKAQAGIRRLRGQVDWDGDLDVSRLDRVSPSR